MERYPTRNGIAISPLEIELPKSRLNLCKQESYNNHHTEFTERAMGRLILTRLLRNLSGQQFILPVDVHDELHAMFDPPELPTPYQAINRVGEAYESQEVLQFGSCHRPKFRLITPDEWEACEKEYKRLK